MADSGSSNDINTSGDKTAFPKAIIESANSLASWKHGLSTRFWFITLLCLVVALVLSAIAIRSGGTEIVVRFQQGYGIKPGDPLRFRGIDVGRVTAVVLDRELHAVSVTILLDPSASGIAKSGSRFWIERPRLSLGRLSGLDTVVGSKYIAVLPGNPESSRETRFEGLESPLTILDSDVVEILIRFHEGHGLEIGDPLKHRGIVIGEVTGVSLSESLSGVAVRVRLREDARTLARAGSQFWVERPKVSLTSVRGLDTLVGGRYLAISPGPKDADLVVEFDGLDVPPAANERLEGGIDVILEGDHRHGLEAGAPVTYRGLPIGYVVSVGLSTDAAEVETRIYIQPAYKQIIRENSQFWSTSGIDLSVGLSGIQLSAETLATIATGGVAVATPNSPGKLAASGHRYRLHRKPENEWHEWMPHLLVGDGNLPSDLKLPQPTRVALRWREKRFGFERTRRRDGWALALEDGRWLGPANLFVPDLEALPGSGVLEIAGKEASLKGVSIPAGQVLANIPIENSSLPETRWPNKQLSVLTEAEDCLASTGTTGLNIALPASRLTPVAGGWRIDSSVAIPPDAHGACVVSTKRGEVIGVIVVESGKASVAKISLASGN